MKRVAILLICLLPRMVAAQNFEDGFNDGDFTKNPTWSGSTANFEVELVENNYVLRLNDTKAGTSYLSTPSSNYIGSWEFFIEIDGSLPSNANFAEIFLMSDTENLMGAVNGYLLRIGESGDDRFKIERVDYGVTTTILEDSTVISTGTGYRINVLRDDEGNWKLGVGEGYNGEVFFSGESAFDTTHTFTSHFGVLVNYTSSRVDDFYFDFKIDDIPTIEFEAFEYGDVLINEFLKDPPPESDLPEYIELINTSSKYLNLNKWMIGDNSTLREISEDDVILYPDTILVLTNDPERLAEVYGEGYYLDTSLPSLNNSGDQIRIFTSEGALVDSLEYTASWGGEDVSLERRTIKVASIYPENWVESISKNFGTPGNHNSVKTDSIPPQGIEASIISEYEIEVLFNERVFIDSETSIRLNNSIQPVQIETSLDTLKILFENEFKDGEELSVFFEGVNDVFGNRSDAKVEYLQFTKISQEAPGHVVINEIMYKRLNSDAPEFVEFFNPTDLNFDLSNWTLEDATGKDALIPEGVILKSHEYLVLSDLHIDIQNGVILSDFPTLNDSEDQLILKNIEGTVIDSITYHNNWGEGESGISLERIDPGNHTNDPSNWDSNISNEGHSIGGKNSIFSKDTTPPKLVYCSLNGSSLTIFFDEFVRFDSDVEFWLDGIKLFPDFVETVQNRATVIEVNESDLEKSKNPSLLVKYISDVQGNMVDQVEHPIVFPIERGSVIINEVLFEPIQDSDDYIQDQTEYIELFNPNNHAISLEGVFMHNSEDEEGNINPLIPISTEHKWAPAKGYFLIYADEEIHDFSESKLAKYYNLEYELESLAMVIERSSLSLSNTSDVIFIADSSGLRIDSLYYSHDWHNPNMIDTRGVSIERIRTDVHSNEASNWSSSTSVLGGTPLKENSINQSEFTQRVDQGISFSSNPFSPDNDGFEDHLIISYVLDEPDYLINVRIFDRYGRFIRNLANSEPAGFEGSLIWNGLTDERNANRVGIYIILFEAFNSASGKRKVFKESVVLARKF